MRFLPAVSVFTLVLPLFSASILAQQRAQAPGARLPHVLIRTEKGEIELEIDTVRAPITGINFLRYVDERFYDGGQFHRTVRADNQPNDSVRIAVIQASASAARRGEGYPAIELERTVDTGVRHLDGCISMGRLGPNTATSSFFICVGDQPALDFGGRRNPDGQGFGAFGRVVRGMDVVRTIHAAPRENQTLTPPIRILSVNRATPGATSGLQEAAPVVTVSPNLRLIPGEHNEPWIAVSQRNSNVLIAAAQQGGGVPGPVRFGVSTVISRDGGRSWAAVTLPDAADTPFDPMVASGPDGELYVMHGVIGGDFLTSLGISSTAKPTIRFWSSSDDGWTWSRPTDLAASVPPDHMRMVVDMTNGPRRGRIYIAWNDVADQFVRDQYEVFLQYSDDKGRTFTAPTLVATGTDGKLVATEPVVLSDGTLLVTWYQYWNPLARAENERMPFYVRRSSDGGRTFGPVEKLFEFGPHIARFRVPEFTRAFSLPIVTADTSSRSRYRDRVYITWDDSRNGESSDIWFIRSLDRGRTWSAPTRINDNARPDGLAYPDHRHTPVVATAPNGDIGILWYDRRDDPVRRCWELYFALSRDGGETFSPNQKITTAPSCPPADMAPVAFVHNLSPRRRDPNTPPDSLLERMDLIQRLGVRVTQVNQQVRDEANAGLRDGRLTVSFGPSRNVWPGHYTGLAADRNGSFHGLWLDRRSGSQELHTARMTPGVPARITGTPADVTHLVEVVVGAPVYVADGASVKVGVQIRNVSDRVIGGPLVLRVLRVSEVGGAPTSVLAGDSPGERDFAFQGKLGSADRLEPGDLSEPVEITLTVRTETGLDTSVDFRVTGVLAAR